MSGRVQFRQEGRLRRCLRWGPLLLALAACPTLRAADLATRQTSETESQSQFGNIRPFLGSTIDRLEMPGVPTEESGPLLAGTPLKTGEPLTREKLHDTMQLLFATGRFSDIQVEADRTETAGVRLTFRTVANFFVGMVSVEGVNQSPTANQLVSASRLQLGELYTQDKLDHALAGIQRLMQDNGFHKANVTVSERRNDAQHQMDLTFRVELGPRAIVGEITLEGDSADSVEQLKETAHFHSGDGVVSSRTTRALQRIRARYQKQDRLLAQVSIASQTYHADRNTVDYVFRVDRGPIVEIAAEGFKLSQRTLKKLVPIYEEGAVDDDLLNEGRRNLQNHMQTLGYFEAHVSVSQHAALNSRNLQVLYTITPGERHRLAAIRISGNHFFSDDLIRSQMKEQPASRLFSHGRFSQALLDEDVAEIQSLYRASGYRQAEVGGKLLSSYQNDPSLLAVQVTIKEGPQTRVAWVRIEGNYTLPQEQMPEIQTEERQAFDESSLADDRDAILSKYFDNGFPNATVDVSYSQVPADKLPLVGVTFTIHEGEQFFVSRVFTNGLHYTRPGVARRQMEVQQGAPLSQQAMLESQRNLYDLGLFKQVNTAIQNPEGTESRKNILVTVREADRYTFDYGIGFEFQTGQPSVGTNQPLGTTGASPRVSFGVTRINVGGRHQTLTMKTNVSRLQQRGLVNFDVPKLMNRDLRFSVTGFYDNTVDVSTFTSERLEGTIQALQTLKKNPRTGQDLTTLAYRFSYRRVKASGVQVADNLIPLLSKPTRVGTPNFLYVRNRRDNDLESTRGSYTTVEGGLAASYFGSEADFGRLLLKNATYHALFRNRATGRAFVIARSTAIGVENPFGTTIVQDPSGQPSLTHQLIPLPERFFSGGGNSHRGFGLNQAGPRDAFTGFPVGGSAVFLNNLELRFPNLTVPYLLENVGFTIFHDMGNVFARPQEMLPSLGRFHQPDQAACTTPPPQGKLSQCSYNYVSHAVGVGVRYQTPIGPLRFDFGYNLNPPVFPAYTNITTRIPPTGPPVSVGQFGYQHAGRFNFSFSVGQSF